MRYLWTLSLSVTLVSVVHGQQCNYPSGCEANPPTCEAPPPRTCQPPAAPPTYAAPPGMFQQPPATGSVYAPVERREVEGAALTFPTLTLRMPNLRLPSVARSRSNARMEIDSASAPYMQQAPMAPYAVAAPQMAVPPAAPNAPQSPSAPTQPPSAPTYPPDIPSAPPQGPRCDAPRAPSCDQQALEQRLKSLEAAEERLLRQLSDLQGALGLAGVSSVGLPPRELPASQPPLIREQTPITAPPYVARPAHYISEPGGSQEPRLLGGRITDVRPLR